MYGKSIHISIWERRQSSHDGHVHLRRINYVDHIITKDEADALHAHYNMPSVYVESAQRE
jgi:hypothetical protein